MILNLFNSELRDNPSTNELIFKPEPPFDRYLRGRMYLDKSCNRRRVYLHQDPNNRLDSTHIPYARYIYQIHHWNKTGTLIPEDLEVDHIDNDCSNDTLDNYQLLTHQQNVQKLTALRGYKWYIVCCAICGELIKKNPRAVELNLQPTTCSISCMSIMRMLYIKDPILLWLKHYQVLYVIHEHDFVYEEYYHSYTPYCKIENIVDDITLEVNPYVQKYIRQSFDSPLNRYDGIEDLRHRLPFSMQCDYGDCFVSPNELSEQRRKLLQECVESGINYLQIAEKLNISHTHATGLMKEFNIPRPVEFRLLQKIKQIKLFYDTGIRNLKEMALAMNVSCSNLRQTFRSHFPQTKIVNNEILELISSC